jgi:hypothetical protein
MPKYLLAGALALAVGCSGDCLSPKKPAAGEAQVAGGVEATEVVPKTTRAEAIAIARKRLQQEACANEIDPERMTVRYGDFGPKGREKRCWVIDFCRRGSAAITEQLWARGYQVAVDASTGEIVEASEYER